MSCCLQVDSLWLILKKLEFCKIEVRKEQSCLTILFKPISSEEMNEVVARAIEESRKFCKKKREESKEERERGKMCKNV